MTVTIDRAVSATIDQLREGRSRLPAELVRYGLVVWTAGNVSAPVPGADLLVMEPRGVSYDDLAADNRIVCTLEGQVVEGERAASSDTAAHRSTW